ncbi:unnamed protein product [Paramecium sonneborni]|uniref:Uncharacterized protein n=1 Tax=Paramecium sonneborni TaxID=65129 RepID=A0A8S1QRC4_9CILI|nr:unnamed protein product [Paramecium sonneborni]
MQEISKELSNQKSLKQFNQTIYVEYQLFIVKSQTMLMNFIELDQTRNQNLKEQSYPGQSQLTKPKKYKNQPQRNKETQYVFDKRFSSELINSIKLNGDCFAIAFNKELSIKITGNDNDIDVHEFKDGQIQFFQTLKGHDVDVSTLYFMKNSNQFISGGYDNTKIIWQIKNSKWQAQYKLKHTGFVNHIITNAKENLIISASDEETIKFWQKQHDQWKLIQTISDLDFAYNLSLNESQNQLICANGDHLMEQQRDDKRWIQIQKNSIRRLRQATQFY